MFNNIVYFIIVLLIFTVSYPGKISKETFLFDFSIFLITWAMFAGYCRWRFAAILKRSENSFSGLGRLTAQYHQTLFILSTLSIILFTLDVYLLNLKYWITLIPGISHFSTLEAVLALLLFFIYLDTIWYFACPVYRRMIQQHVPRRSFIRSNIQLNIPILFPWFAISLIYDLIGMSPWAWAGRLLNGVAGNIILISVFVLLLMIYMPVLVQYWWGCKPLPETEKLREMQNFMRHKGFKYRRLLRWPIFEGRMMTAGIMGIIPRYRYILITDALMEILTPEELKAVLAHEIGHAKYRHLLVYLLFFLGFTIISFGLQDILQDTLFLTPFFINIISSNDPQSITLFYLISSLPMLLLMIVYFRFLMGFFMRNFERQADLYAAQVMGGPGAIISSLEKIADFSGKSRDIPSWHHFSIGERVASLMKTRTDPGLFRRHNRFLTGCLMIYLLCMVALGYFLNFSPLKKHALYSMAEKTLNERLLKDPDDISLHENYALVCQEMGEYGKATQAYERVIELDPNYAGALNNLAWLYVTANSEDVRNITRGLALAERAVALVRSAVFLDTLAEAYYVNGFVDKAVQTIEEAIAKAKENREYYEGQLKKFRHKQVDRLEKEKAR